MRSLRAQVKNNRLLRAALFEAQNAYHASPFAGRAPSRIDHAEGAPRYFLSAMIRVKDEARFLPEWLAHHLNVGVEHVFVYDNNSSDDIERVVMPFIERGLVTYVPWPTVPASPSSNNHFLTEFGPSSEWVAFFDADELLVEDTPGALLETLGAAGRVPAIAVNWRYYGSSGHEVVPSGLVTATFTRADAMPNQHVKVIARPAMVRRYRNSHNSYYRRGRVARTPAGRRVHGSFVTPDLPARLVLNHYVYRSREDYERKSSHGFVDAAGVADRARRTSLAEAEFDRHNDVEVKLPERVLRATADLLRELGYAEELYDGAAMVAGRGSPGADRTD
jgi:Glycosyltransferase family 92